MLKKMHVAVDRPAAAKPTATTPPAAQWVVVYSTNSRYKLHRWVRWMDDAGIPARCFTRGAESRLETLPEFYDAALQFIEGNRHRLIKARQKRLLVVEPHQISGATIGGFPGMCIGYVVGFLIINYSAFATANPEVYLMCWTAVGWVFGAVLGAQYASPAACLNQSAAPTEQDEGYGALKFDAGRYSAARVFDLLRRHGIKPRYSHEGARSMIEVEEHELPRAALILHKHRSDPALLRAARPPKFHTRTLVSFGSLFVLVLCGGLLAGSTSQYLLGHVSMAMAVVLNITAIVVCLATAVILMCELQRTTIQ